MTRRRNSQHAPGNKAKLGAPPPRAGGKAQWGRTRDVAPGQQRPGSRNPFSPKPGKTKTLPAKTAPTTPPHRPSPPRGAPLDARPSRPETSAPPRIGEWLWTTREGAEQDLVEELLLAKDTQARMIAPALVASRLAPSVEGRVALTFARQGFPLSVVAEDESPDALAGTLARGLELPRAGSYALHVWVPDSTQANPLAARARALEDELAAIAGQNPELARVDTRELGPGSIPFVQVCLASETRAFAGKIASNRTLSLAPGGRLRTHVGGDLPSRAARKIAEALVWLEMAPEAGEVCVDLGAAPGGWTWFLLDRNVRVIAVDPAKLRPDLLRRRGLTYVNKSAFEYAPEEPVDWLFCDMAWRPLEVAQMLARWARQRDATILVANFKLPMKRKAEMVVAIRQTLEQGGWRAVRTRQLYHDRDEVTLSARLG